MIVRPWILIEAMGFDSGAMGLDTGTIGFDGVSVDLCPTGVATCFDAMLTNGVQGL